MKQFEARPWLALLMTATAAFAIWNGRDDVLVLSLDSFGFVLSLPLAWALLPALGVGLLILGLGMASPLPVRHARDSQINPTLAARYPALDDADAEPGPGPATDQEANAASEPPGGSSAPSSQPLPLIPEPASPGAFRLDLDGQGRILGAVGPGAGELSARPGGLEGVSLLTLVPVQVRAQVVAAVRNARAEPGRPISLPKLRLQLRSADQQVAATVPLRLTFKAGKDGALAMLAKPASRPAPVQGPQDDDRFSRIFHTSPDAIMITRQRDGAIVDFNESFTRLLGYSREQAIGRATADLALWVNAAERDEILAQFSRTHSVTGVEAQLRSVTGNTMPVELSMRFIELDGDLCILCIARDITKRLEAEVAARASEEKFTQVFTQNPDALVVVRRRDLTIRDVNPSLIRGSGYSAEELVGQPLSKFQPLGGIRELQQTIELLSEHGRLANREMRFLSKSGQELTTLVSAIVTDLDGEPSLLCIIRDISDLRNTQEQLRRSEERFRGAFENAPIGIMLLDPQGHIFQANRFATDLLNYPDGALDSMHVSRLVPPDERSDLKEQLGRLLRSGELLSSTVRDLAGDDESRDSGVKSSSREATLRGERRMLRADGLEVWTNCHVVLQRGRDGEPLYSIMQIADITEMKTSQRRMERLAFYDTLTELANRRLFNDRLSQAVEHCRRHELRAALLYLDLDQFKRVNDTLGHESGDVLLQEVAKRLIGCVRKEDTVGRPGGDEFTILLYDVETVADAGQVAEKILRALERPITVSGHQLIVTTSIGITVIPEDGLDPNALTKNADLAMYRAKEQGRNNYQFYREELNTKAVQRLRTEHELRRALERSEFELHFQPVVRLRDQTIVGVESLLRWNHPERGLVPPDEFVGVAEETGAIVEIGNWVIEEACAAGRLMADQRGAPLCIAVNISPRQFRDPNLVDTIRQSLRTAKLSPEYLELEITETMLMQDVEAASAIVVRLHELGIRLAIDDFGTGYSSLNYLKKFPIDTVKVDKTFVMDIPESSDDMEITAAVIAMAHRLRMSVVAEGVETQAQLDFLTEQQCDMAQGFLFSRALPLTSITRLLGANVSLLQSRG